MLLYYANSTCRKSLDKATKKSLDQLRNSLSGTKDVIDRIIDDASERRASYSSDSAEFRYMVFAGLAATGSPFTIPDRYTSSDFAFPVRSTRMKTRALV